MGRRLTSLQYDGTTGRTRTMATDLGRWKRKISDFAHRRVGDSCQVFMGAGWTRGTVIDKRQNAVLVQLNGSKRQVMCYDARNLK